MINPCVYPVVIPCAYPMVNPCVNPKVNCVLTEVPIVPTAPNKKLLLSHAISTDTWDLGLKSHPKNS